MATKIPISTDAIDMSAASEPPVLPGLPIWGNTRAILRDTGAVLVDAHERMGPVFRVHVLWHGYVVIAGAAADVFIKERFDERYCSRQDFFAAIEREFGSADLTLARSGERHTRLRQPLAVAFSRQVASPFVPSFIEAARAVAQGWPEGSTRCVMDETKRIAFEQYCRAMAGSASPRFNFRDCLLVSEYGMNVGARVYPRAAFRLPWYRAAHRRAFGVLRDVVATRKAAQGQSAGSTHTIIDTLLSSTDAAGKMVTEDEAVTYAAYGIAAACAYVSRLTGFMLYEIVRDGDLKARLTEECDAAFARGIFDAGDVRRMRLLRAVFQEALRLHPISPGMPFTADEDFVFMDKRIRKGDPLVISPVPLAFSACPFHNPRQFDPSRFDESPATSLNAASFHPFGLGQRSCVATGLVELMAVTAVATLLHERVLSLDPPDYRLRLKVRPLPSPDRHFRVHAGPRTPNRSERAPVQSESELALASLPGHDHPVVAEVLREATTRRFSAGACIIRQGDPADAFYILKNGRVNVTREAGGSSRHLAELTTGDYFGEIGLLQDAPRTATVTAGTEGAVTLVLDRDAFLKVVAASDLLADEIVSLARQRLSAADVAR